MPKEEQANRTFTQNARRTQIIQAAIETLAEIGYQKTSFNQISKRANLRSTGMISYHFSGKPELYSEVAATVLAMAEETTGSRMEREETFRGRLRAYIEANFEFLARYPAHTQALAQILMMDCGRDLTRSQTLARSVLSVERLSLLLEQGRSAGEFGAFDALTMALAIRGALDGVLRRYLKNVDLDLERCAAELTAAFDQCTRPRQ
ncbi:TetR family transcriptional regulator [Streptomyces sp. SCSIO ZS0520]|uniref:TetR family transcriptional regulator n=1 Tax=Streptomyces sp. SCSIO ZS0520 TaxID=2892996 RepID=UPI0021D85431|nr:TetR family transcriptional regulator [Streptomyces sp. SCSIO ZS0520]